MKIKNLQFLLLLFLVGINFSCEPKVKVAENKSEETQGLDVNTSDFMEYSNAKKMGDIDAEINPTKKIESLYWEKQSEKYGSQYIEVEGYLNEEGNLVKIIEYFIDGNYQPEGKRMYYLEDNKLIAFQEEYSTWKDSLSTKYIEKRTVFDGKRPALTQERTSVSYDEIEGETWGDIPVENHSLERVNKILSGEGEFNTHFISVIKANQLFLLLGENKQQVEERYTTAVRVDEMTPFIEDLLNHLDDYKFRPVKIKFKVVGGNNSPEFRVLTDISWGN